MCELSAEHRERPTSRSNGPAACASGVPRSSYRLTSPVIFLIAGLIRRHGTYCLACWVGVPPLADVLVATGIRLDSMRAAPTVPELTDVPRAIGEHPFSETVCPSSSFV
jgi:hypothetical protein